MKIIYDDLKQTKEQWEIVPWVSDDPVPVYVETYENKIIHDVREFIR
jgi:hypothetical protein